MTPGLALESGEFIPAHELNAHVQKPPEIEHKGVVMSKSDQEMNTSGFDAADMATAAAQGFRDGVASVQGAPVAEKPYAYAVYFPDQPTEELVHDLDELCEDLTNREHSIIELYERKGAAQAGVPAGHAKALLEKVDAIIGCINEAHHSQGSGWKQGCFMAADRGYEELKAMLAAAPQPSPAPAPADPGFDECVASGQSCSYGPYGRQGETQCQYCGSEPSSPAPAQPGQEGEIDPADIIAGALQTSRSHACEIMRAAVDADRAARAAPQPAVAAGREQIAEAALCKVLAAVQRYLPPNGPNANDTLSEIIEIVDPWPLGPLEKS